jgi:hypothetical protein
MPRRLIDRFRGVVKSVPAYKPGKFRSKPLRGATPLPISVVGTVEEWEGNSQSSVPTKPSLETQENSPTASNVAVEEPEDQEEPEPAFGEIRPGATDLRRYIDPSWKD